MKDPVIGQVARNLRRIGDHLESLQQEVNAASKNQQASNTHTQQQSPIQVQSELRLPVAITEYCEAENNDRKSIFKKVKTGFEILGLLGVVATLVFTAYQASQMREQTKAMVEALKETKAQTGQMSSQTQTMIDTLRESNKQTAEMAAQTNSMNDTLKVARRQTAEMAAQGRAMAETLSETREQTKLARENFELAREGLLDARSSTQREQGASIKVDGSLAQIKNVSRAALRMRNLGKGIAFRATMRVFMELVDAKSAPSLQWKENKRGRETFYPEVFPDEPTSPAEIGLLDENGGEFRRITATEMKSLTDGNSYISVFGVVSYEDNFGKHWTRFCLWGSLKVGAYTSRACVDWNGVGDGEPPE